jgi:hypothetical protein
MKKGFLTLAVVTLAFVGSVAFAAVPGMWGIPDVIIGDNEDDPAITDNYFVFTDAFAFADYYYWVESGEKALQWHYTDAGDIEVIGINGSTPSAVVDLTNGGVTTGASFTNIMITPYGSVDDPTLVNGIPDGATDPVVVDLQLDNFLITDEQSITVYTADEGNDALTNEYYVSEVTSEAFTADPGWKDSSEIYVDGPIGPGIGRPNGLSDAVHDYDGTSDAYTLASTGVDNTWGYWREPYETTSLLIQWTDGAAYVFVASVFGEPDFPPGGESDALDYIPDIRLRVNMRNETINGMLRITNEEPNAISSSSLTPTTVGMIFDPRDHAGFAVQDLDNMYFTFEILDFYTGAGASFDKEGLVGLTNLAVDSFPIKMMPREATLVSSYPKGDSFGDMDYAEHFYDPVQFGAGGNPVIATTDSQGNLLLSSQNVYPGYGIHQLKLSDVLVDDTSKWMWFRFKVGSSLQSVPWMRLRVYNGDFSRVAMLGVLDGQGGYQFPASPLATEYYNVFFVPEPHMNNTQLKWAFDLIDFVNNGDVDLRLEAVDIYEVDPPVVAP